MAIIIRVKTCGTTLRRRIEAYIKLLVMVAVFAHLCFKQIKKMKYQNRMQRGVLFVEMAGSIICIFIGGISRLHLHTAEINRFYIQNRIFLPVFCKIFKVIDQS